MDQSNNSVTIPPIPRPCAGCGAGEAEHHVDDCSAVRAAVERAGVRLTDDPVVDPARIRKYRAALAAARMRGAASGDRTEVARAAIDLADAEQSELRASMKAISVSTAKLAMSGMEPSEAYHAALKAMEFFDLARRGGVA